LTTILATFIISLVLSLLLTPLAGWLGTRFGALDKPQKRKAHTRPIPRIGGLAIFTAFFLALALASLFMTEVSDKLVLERKTVFFLVGALVVFGVGLFDDFHRLGPMVKFIFQLIGASVAFYGGLRIEFFSFFGLDLHFGFICYFVTLFWFILFINAINLIDGLDGLAAGITFFASLVLIILSVMKGEHLIGMLFAALAGVCLGFLRYNFNPATIFMGDSGSYFLGYAIAGLSIMGSIKSQVGAAMLIPVLALGIPLFDTILSPVRRFVRGQKMFHPDNGHIHHRLVGLGFTTKKAVWIIYVNTFCLCIVAIFIVNIGDERAGLLLITIGAGAVVFIRKLGFFEHFASDKLYGWFKDVTDEAGFSHDRRSFLNLQIEIGKSGDLEELWTNVCKALEKLKFDMGEMDIKKTGFRVQGSGFKGLPSEEMNSPLSGMNSWMNGWRGQKSKGRNRRSGCEDRRSDGCTTFFERDEFLRTEISRGSPIPLDKNFDRKEKLFWTRNGFDSSNDICKKSLMKLELPLIDNGNEMLGTLWLIKDLNADAISHYTLRRVEHLRRTVIGTLEKI